MLSFPPPAAEGEKGRRERDAEQSERKGETCEERKKCFSSSPIFHAKSSRRQKSLGNPALRLLTNHGSIAIADQSQRRLARDDVAVLRQREEEARREVSPLNNPILVSATRILRDAARRLLRDRSETTLDRASGTGTRHSISFSLGRVANFREEDARGERERAS